MPEPSVGRRPCGCCFIVPPELLRALAQGRELVPRDPTVFQRSFVETQRLRQVREGHRMASITTRNSLAAEPTTHRPEEHLFDCHGRTTLPGRPVSDIAHDPFKTVFDTTAKVAEFYQTVLGRNSIDDRGMDLVSSLDYGHDFQNAFWNGQQMVYGNGDQQIFVDFWRSPDVIGHELTHGVTQNESGLRYESEPGALNESISDCFGAVFHQWLAKQPASRTAGWLIGAGIMGPAAKTKGFTCLRDMVNPRAKHCLSPQPDSYADFDPTADVHVNSGIPNKAFALFARALGGNAWDAAIKVWYAACTGGNLSSTATFADFARGTILAADRFAGPTREKVGQAVREAWAGVDLSLAAV